MFDLIEEIIVHSGIKASAKQHRCRGEYRVALVMNKKSSWRITNGWLSI